MNHAQRNGFLFNRTCLSRRQAGFAAQFHIAGMSKHQSTFAEFVGGTNYNLVELIDQFLATVHTFCRPAVGVSEARGQVAEGITHGNGCIGDFDGFIFTGIGSNVSAFVRIEIIGKVTQIFICAFMTFSVLSTYADKQVVFVVVTLDFSDLRGFGFTVLVGVCAFVMAVGKIGGETAVFISQTGGILLLAGLFVLIFVVRIAVVARRVGCIELEPAK